MPPTLPTPGWLRAQAEADLTLALPDGSPMFFRRIPAGSFLMGSRGESSEEEPRHRVQITAPFYLGTFPVTQAQFAQWTQSAVYAEWFAGNKDKVDEDTPHQNGFDGNPDHPAENLSWYEADAFAGWLTRQVVQPQHPALTATLPSEAQWEHACRAGTDTDYHSGDGEAALREVGWFDGNADDQTHPVGQLQPNAFGLYDLHGNVWEWCSDVDDAAAYAKRSDGWEATVWTPDDERDPNRVMRGGSWIRAAWSCRAAFRDRWWPRYRVGSQGFRLVLSPGPVGAEPETAWSGGREGAGARDERSSDRKAGADLSTLKLPRRPA